MSRVAAAILLAPSWAWASVCGPDYLLVPHEGVVLPPGFRVVYNEGQSRCESVEVRDEDGVLVTLIERESGCYAPIELPAGAYTFAADPGGAAAMEGSFRVDDAASREPPTLQVGRLSVSRVDTTIDGCGDQPRIGDFVAGVDFSADAAALGGWWLVLNVTDDQGALLGAAQRVVSPPAVPGGDRGIGAILDDDGAKTACGALRWVGPDGSESAGVDLECAPIRRSCSTTGGGSPSQAVLVLLAGLWRRRVPRVGRRG